MLQQKTSIRSNSQNKTAMNAPWQLVEFTRIPQEKKLKKRWVTLTVLCSQAQLLENSEGYLRF